MSRKRKFKIAGGVGGGLLVTLATILSLTLGNEGIKQRYEYIGTRMLVDDDIWTQVVDPCDAIYSHIVGPAKSWGDQFGMSERSVTMYNIALAKMQRDELRTMVVDVNDKLDSIVQKQEQILKMIGREVEEIGTQ